MPADQLHERFSDLMKRSSVSSLSCDDYIIAAAVIHSKVQPDILSDQTFDAVAYNTVAHLFADRDPDPSDVIPAARQYIHYEHPVRKRSALPVDLPEITVFL